MAQGTVTLFEEFSKYIGDGSHDLDADSFKVALLSDVIGTGINASDATPDYADYSANEVTGGGYTAGGEAITVTWTELNGTATFEVTTATTTWTQNGTGPTNINTALIYNTTHAGTNDAVAFMDMRDGGTTAISLQDGDITITWAANLFTLS